MAHNVFVIAFPVQSVLFNVCHVWSHLTCLIWFL